MSDDTCCRSQKASAATIPADQELPAEEWKSMAKRELSENEDTKADSLKLLRSMLKGEKNLRWQDDDLFLLAFLRGRKFDVKRSFNLIRGLYTTFGKHRDLFYDLSFDRMKEIMEVNTTYFFPYRDREGSVIFATHFTGWNPQETTAQEFLACVTLGLIRELRSPSTQVAGFQFIVDFKDFSLKHLLYIRPFIIGFFTDIIQSTVPIRLKGFHVVNENHVVSYIWPICKQLFSKKITERIHFHGDDMKSLHNFIPASILPAEYGGDLPPYNNADWREKMENSIGYLNHVRSFGYEKYLKQDRKKKSKESKETLAILEAQCFINE